MIYACRYKAGSLGIRILESDLVSSFVSVNPVTLAKTIRSPNFILIIGQP